MKLKLLQEDFEISLAHWTNFNQSINAFFIPSVQSIGSPYGDLSSPSWELLSSLSECNVHHERNEINKCELYSYEFHM